jgi:glycosyltransferase involved in cell wall biosynthesis
MTSLDFSADDGRFMRIAQVAPLIESVPPQAYGGTERVVSYLTEELVRRGHEVTLFATGDSVTRARLIATCPQALRFDANCRDPLARQLVLLEHVYRMRGEFDLVHFHVDYVHFPMSRRHRVPRLTTLHGRLDAPDLQDLYRVYSDEPLVSISRAQRNPLADARWLGTVYHGLPEERFECHRDPGKYLAFLGRISPEKRLDRAIEIAMQAGMRLRVAAKIDRADQAYYETEIRPLLHAAPSLVEFVGEIGDEQKSDFLGNAAALLFPIDWPEPFGLVMIESLACGTPVIAYRNGSVPEVIDDGVTGWIVDSMADAVAAVQRIHQLSRATCRAEFERRFSVRRMVDDYLSIYHHVCQPLRPRLWNRLMNGRNGKAPGHWPSPLSTP